MAFQRSSLKMNHQASVGQNCISLSHSYRHPVQEAQDMDFAVCLTAMPHMQASVTTWKVTIEQVLRREKVFEVEHAE